MDKALIQISWLYYNLLCTYIPCQIREAILYGMREVWDTETCLLSYLDLITIETPLKYSQNYDSVYNVCHINKFSQYQLKYSY